MTLTRLICQLSMMTRRVFFQGTFQTFHVNMCLPVEKEKKSFEYWEIVSWLPRGNLKLTESSLVSELCVCDKRNSIPLPDKRTHDWFIVKHRFVIMSHTCSFRYEFELNRVYVGYRINVMICFGSPVDSSSSSSPSFFTFHIVYYFFFNKLWEWPHW